MSVEVPARADDPVQLLDLVEQLLAEASAQGATSAEAGLSVDRGLSVTARMGEVETVEHHKDRNIGITVYVGQKKGSASTTDFSAEAIRETVAAALRIARYSTPDEYAGLPDASLLATEFPELDIYHPWALDVDRAIELAVECEQTALGHDAEIVNSEGASVDTHAGFHAFGNSLGFVHGVQGTRHSLSCSVLGRRGESMQRDYWYTVARDEGSLEPAREVGLKAAQRTLRRLGARSLSTRNCAVLYSAEAAASLVGHFITAIRGGNLYRKSSFLLDALDTQVFPEFVRIHEQPHLQKALGSAWYDSEGVACRARDIVAGGVLQSYVLGTYSARKLGMISTGNAGGVHNLTVEPGNRDRNELIGDMQRGLLVTELMGQGVNTVTGDYSRGAAGFWVENGEILYPVEEITVAGNLGDMFRNLVAVGNDLDVRGNTRVGSLLIEEMTVAGT